MKEQLVVLLVLSLSGCALQTSTQADVTGGEGGAGLELPPANSGSNSRCAPILSLDAGGQSHVEGTMCPPAPDPRDYLQQVELKAMLQRVTQPVVSPKSASARARPSGSE